MKTIISKCKISLGLNLFIGALILLSTSCSLEELPEPYPQPAEYPAPSPGDTITWSWGMIESNQPGEWRIDDSNQQITIEPN